MTDVEAQVAQFDENFQRVRTEIAKVIVEKNKEEREK